jgi:hypothetical protein
MKVSDHWFIDHSLALLHVGSTAAACSFTSSSESYVYPRSFKSAILMLCAQGEADNIDTMDAAQHTFPGPTFLPGPGLG